ncbi:hybrid sensor histidine kinase/response regulator [Phenylobacterium deserti]|uniref:histidine kinase n=2 Tax=Phenylobacterium deserti TaxID=1914756 RepID=A0A328AEE4_9CAUL|nr:hybrid sensor histidine kinase/response regulator [Phenylobacterium deserti]
MATHDWASTPLGARETWPAPLKTMVSVMLDSRQPMFLLWGERRIVLFNDAYLPVLGARAGAALGRGLLDVWPELEQDVGPLIERAYAGEALHFDDRPFVLERNGYPEEAFFSFSYTPVRGEGEQVLGVLCLLQETTREVASRRRQAFLLSLEAALRVLSDSHEIIQTAQRMLGEHLGVSRVGYGRVDSEARFFTTDRNWTDGSVPHRSGVHDLAGFGPDVLANLRNGVPLVIDDAYADPRTNFPEARAAFDAIDTRAVITASLLKNGKMAAALYVHDRQPRRWTSSDAELVLETAERIWSVVERAEAEMQVGRVLESMQEAFVLLDRQFRVVRINAEALRLDGRPAEAMLGRTHWELWPGSENNIFGQLYQDAMRTMRPGSLEGPYDRPDGRRAWMEVRVYPSQAGLAIFYRDISRRHEAAQRQARIEAELRESEERLRIAQRAGRIGAFELFPDTGMIKVSEEFQRLWGLPRDGEFKTHELLAQINADDLKQVGTGQAYLDNNTLEYIEYRIRRADDGREQWMARRGEVITDSTGRRRFLGVSYEITDRKEAELALQRLNEGLEAEVAQRTAERDRMWRLSTDVMLVAGFDASIVAVNPAWTTLFDWSEDELIGRAFLDLVHPDDVATTLAEVGRLEQGLTTLRFENRYRGRDGEYRWVSWTAVPSENFIHAVGRDVTAEKLAAAELEQTQAALRQAQKMEAVGQLTGGIAHDFNNLLTGVLGSLELLTRRLQQGRLNELDRYVSAATTSANRAAALTQRLLAFSRRQPLDPKAVDANRLLKDMDELLQRTVGEAIELEFKLDKVLWTTRCDPHQLESGVLNLAINARDAMPDGGRLTLETRNVEVSAAEAGRDLTPGPYVCISVSDTGSGIAPEILDRVVEPFFTTKPIGQGTGLGLSMIYGFAQQSEGHLQIESRVGEGTTVRLYLPRAQGSVDDPDEEAPAELSPVAEARQEVVLVVEDETAVRDLVIEVLSELGYRTLEATDGPSGLQVLQSDKRIDLLVTDVGLPGLNGRQLADAARAVRPELKVLFMTGYAEAATRASGFLDLGMQMITKPFAIEALTVRIQEMLADG